MTMQRIDQGMAAAAASALPPVVDKELRSRYRQLRAMLHQAGLAGTYAYIAAKAGGPGDTDKLAVAYRRVGEAIRDRLAGLGLLPVDARQLPVAAVMKELGKMDAVQYARASAEASAFAGWLSRLADAAFQEAQGRNGDG